MKRTLALAALFAGLLLVAVPAEPARAEVSVSFSFFHSSLAPYGHWVTVGSYGQCWRPVGLPGGWQPYTVGHWVYTDYGWTWISSDPWGDVTYRYGTWTFSPAYGWVWVPGFVWGPAWVTWSFNNDYIGWAPLPPTFSFTVAGYYGSPVYVSRSRYCFVPARQFVTASNVYDVRVPVRQNAAILARSRRATRFQVSGGVVRNEGLGVNRIQAVTKRPIQPVSAREVGIQPARVQATRTGSKRVALVAPASAKVAPASAKRVETSGRAVAAPQRRPAPKASKPSGPPEARSERGTKPSATRKQSAPSVQRVREPQAKPSVSRAPASEQRRVSAPSRPASPQTVHASAARPQPPAQRSAPQNVQRGKAKKPAVKPAAREHQDRSQP